MTAQAFHSTSSILKAKHISRERLRLKKDLRKEYSSRLPTAQFASTLPTSLAKTRTALTTKKCFSAKTEHQSTLRRTSERQSAATTTGRSISSCMSLQASRTITSKYCSTFSKSSASTGLTSSII